VCWEDTIAAKRRKKKLIKIRKPKMRLTSKGIKVTRPSARIGGKAGVNISSKGVSASARTRRGTISTRKGRSTGLLGLLFGRRKR
jgi:hypothetical protein